MGAGFFFVSLGTTGGRGGGQDSVVRRLARNRRRLAVNRRRLMASHLTAVGRWPTAVGGCRRPGAFLGVPVPGGGGGSRIAPCCVRVLDFEGGPVACLASFAGISTPPPPLQLC